MLRQVIACGLGSLLLQGHVASAQADHSGHDHSGMDHSTPAPAPAPAMDMDMDHSGMDHSGMDMGAPVALLDEPCVSDPTAASCSSYVYPDALAQTDQDAVCAMMPFMMGCSIRDACNAGAMGEGNAYCAPFTTLATMCHDGGMSGMNGCGNYVALCMTPGTVVQQCFDYPAVPSIMQTSSTQAAIVQACSTHSMPGCMECPATGSACPNPLATTQRLCLEMTGMEMCDRFVTMCDAAGDDLSHFCTNNLGTYDPPMRMYFHTGVRDMILFRGWVPKSTGALVGSIVAVLLAGILAGALRAYRACTEAFHRARQNTHIRHDPQEVSQQSLWGMSGLLVPHHLARSLLTFFTILLDYALMLIAMTFNVSLFFAVVTGLALGVLLFSHLPERYAQRLQARALLSADLTCGCGSTIRNSSAKRHDDDRADSMESGEMARDDRRATSPPPAPGVCCSMKPVLVAEAEHEPAGEADAMLPQCCKM